MRSLIWAVVIALFAFGFVTIVSGCRPNAEEIPMLR